MGRGIWRRLRNEKGQSFVEFAIVAPMALVLILGVVDLGRATSYWLDSSHLANVGARAAAVNGCPPAPPPSPPGCVDPSAPDGLPKALWIQAESPQLRDKLTVCIWDLDPSGATRASGSAWLKKDEIRVTVRSKFTFIPFLKLADIPAVTGRSSMRLETDWSTSPATNPYGWTYGSGPDGSAASIGLAGNQCPQDPN